MKTERSEQLRAEYAVCAHCGHRVQWHLGDTGDCERYGCTCRTFIHPDESTSKVRA